MSTRAERAFRASRHILPVKITVRQTVQVVDADVRRSPIALKIEEEEMIREVRQALNRHAYGDEQ